MCPYLPVVLLYCHPITQAFDGEVAILTQITQQSSSYHNKTALINAIAGVHTYRQEVLENRLQETSCNHMQLKLSQAVPV